MYLNNLEKLEQDAHDSNVHVYNYYLGEDNFHGIYIDGNIALNTCLNTTTEKACVLAEELGHHETSSGNILDQSSTANRKQEYKARIWAYREMISPDDLFSAFQYGCRNRYEIAEYIGVTEEFLEDALNYFKTQYPDGYSSGLNQYLIRFIPNLQVLALFD